MHIFKFIEANKNVQQSVRSVGQSRQTPSPPPDCMKNIIESKIGGSHIYVLQYNYNRNTLVYRGGFVV